MRRSNFTRRVIQRACTAASIQSGVPTGRRRCTATVCVSVNFKMPSAPCRARMPDSFRPPQGASTDPQAAAEMAARARAEVEQNWDMKALTRRLADSYREMVQEKRKTNSPQRHGGTEKTECN